MKKRQCPGCGSAMQVLTSGDVEVDRCMFCGGLWLDRGELGKLAGNVRPRPGAKASARGCLNCDKALVELRVEQVLLDVCNSCGGVFLDDGELDALAKREVPLKREVPAEERDSELTFRCPGCAETWDVRQGLSTANGLSCGRCYGAVGHSSSPLPVDGYANVWSDQPYGGTERGAAGAANALRRRGAPGLLTFLGGRFLLSLLNPSDDF